MKASPQAVCLSLSSCIFPQFLCLSLAVVLYSSSVSPLFIIAIVHSLPLAPSALSLFVRSALSIPLSPFFIP